MSSPHTTTSKGDVQMKVIRKPTKRWWERAYARLYTFFIRSN